MLAQSKARLGLPMVLNNNESNLGPILPCFRDITAFVRWKPHFPYSILFRSKFKGVPLRVDLWCWVCGVRNAKLTDREIIFKELQPMSSRYLNVTDRQMDRRLCCSSTALFVASRGKNTTAKSAQHYVGSFGIATDHSVRLVYIIPER